MVATDPEAPASDTAPHANTRNRIVTLLTNLDTFMYAIVALAFFVAALLALVYSVLNILHSAIALSIPLINLNTLVTSILEYVSDLLLILIILEVLSTIRSYLGETGENSVTPFLFIGIISATRGILTIGARLSVEGQSLSNVEFQNALIELGVNAAIIVALGLTARIIGNTSIFPRRGGERPRKPDPDEIA